MENESLEEGKKVWEFSEHPLKQQQKL